LIAESFFPDHPHTNPTAQFFVKAARSIFARMLCFSPTPDRLMEMFTDESLIDFCVAGTEHAHLIDKAAKAQRAGVLATLSEVGASLKLLPTIDECQGGLFTFREWAQRRHRRIFITSTQSTREAMRRLHAAWFNIMLGKLLGANGRKSERRSCWVIIDEVHALKRLPVLETALVEARKYKVKMVHGTQNKAQFEAHYERAAATMLSSSHTKILMRCNEPQSARWVSEMIGEQGRRSTITGRSSPTRVTTTTAKREELKVAGVVGWPKSWDLKGEVSSEQYERLVAGQDPNTGEQLVKSVSARETINEFGEKIVTSEHRAGWDATISAPKSVSLAALVGDDERVRDAHRESVDEALNGFEEYLQARGGGDKPAITTGKMVAAQFEHTSSRPDRINGYAAPQLHTHVVVFNMTQTEDGKVRSVQPLSCIAAKGMRPRSTVLTLPRSFKDLVTKSKLIHALAHQRSKASVMSTYRRVARAVRKCSRKQSRSRSGLSVRETLSRITHA
jgi:hypothetical protein